MWEKQHKQAYIWMYGMVTAFKDFQMHFEVLEMWSDAAVPTYAL